MSTLNIQAVQSQSLNAPVQFKDSAGTEIGTLCRAWVNFNGTGTVAIRASFNVLGITDNGTGDYTVNFANALPDANYSVSGFAEATGGATVLDKVAAPATNSAVRINVTRVTGGATGIDSPFISISIFR